MVDNGRGPLGTPASHDGSFIHAMYGNFAGGSTTWSGPQFAPDGDELASHKLGSTGLFMADSIYYWSGNNGWLYNHGEHQPSPGGISAITGTNQLFGDGAVRWAGEEVFTPQANQNMIARQAAQGIHFVSHNGTLSGDLNYYAEP